MEVWQRQRQKYNKMSEVDDISIVQVMNSVKLVKYMFDTFRLVLCHATGTSGRYAK